MADEKRTAGQALDEMLGKTKELGSKAWEGIKGGAGKGKAFTLKHKAALIAAGVGAAAAGAGYAAGKRKGTKSDD